MNLNITFEHYVMIAGNGLLYLHGVRAGVPLQKYAFGAGDKLTLAASSAVVGNFSRRASVPIVSAVRYRSGERHFLFSFFRKGSRCMGQVLCIEWK